MNETLNGKQVLALLAQDEVPDIECGHPTIDDWCAAPLRSLTAEFLRTTNNRFRIKPTPQRRLSVTLANGEVVSWPEPVRKVLDLATSYYAITGNGDVVSDSWNCGGVDIACLKAGNVHLTREAAQEHADALRKINTQEVV